MKKIIATLILTLLLVPITVVYGAQKHVEGIIVVNGVTLKEKATVINGNAMIPFRELFETLGMTVDWNEKSKTVTAKNSDIEISMTNAVLTATINDQSVPLTQAPFLEETDNKFYINTRVVSEAAGAIVNWDNKNKIATIIKN
ncbi:N-acetylmuramoyl-L-alanine amidase [Paenibacillaceae bacterium GAS479]|nr:N-acetylmuramoyl-L-alanine amidase [Paenibacillaceae bacterium GAS479]